MWPFQGHFVTELERQKFIVNLGVDALSKNLKPEILYKKICKSEVPIKQILLNQKIISGIGNIYASEILFDARISPLMPGKSLKISLIMQLIKSIRRILNKSINIKRKRAPVKIMSARHLMGAESCLLPQII